MKNRIAALLRRLERQEGDRPKALVPYRRGEQPPDPPPGYDPQFVEEVVITRDPETGELLDCHGDVVRVDEGGRIIPPPDDDAE
jgi:hypothetical protein